MEKPSKVEVGQRRKWKDDLEPSDTFAFTVTGIDGLQVTIRYTNGAPGRWGVGEVQENSRLHGEPTAGAATKERAPQESPLTAFQVLQSKERARQEKREEDARAVAAFCNEWDLLPEAKP